MVRERGGEGAPTCRIPQPQPSKGREDDWKKSPESLQATVLSVFWDFVRKLKTQVREGDQAGVYKHQKTIKLEGKQGRSSAYVKDEIGALLGMLNSSANDGFGRSTLSSTPSHRGLT